MSARKLCRNAYVLFLTATIVGCGGGESGTGVIGGDPTSIHTGVITGFGSVYVTGIEFMTPETTYTLDGAAGSETQLAVGMVVTVRGSVDANGTTGTATSIEFEDEVEGIVLSNTIPPGTVSGSLNVMGRTVVVDASTQFSSAVGAVTTLDQLQAGHVVEVSGHSSGANNIHATRIELKRATHAGEDIEVKGVVGNLGSTTFTIGTLTVSYAQAGTLSNGWYVEVHSTQGINNGVLIASEVEKLSETGGKAIEGSEGDSIEQEGLVSSALVNGQFAVNGIAFTVTGATQYEPETKSGSDLVLNARVEVTGSITNAGVLVAEQVEFKQESDLEAKGEVTAVDPTNGAFTMFGKQIIVSATTILKDERDELHYFSLADLVILDRVEIHGYAQDSDTWVATQLERVDFSTDPGSLSGVLNFSAGDYSVGGVAIDFTACSGCTIPPAGTEVDLEGTWTGTAFSVLQID